jgi:GH35 family endo-1,4-beta-xylanase
MSALSRLLAAATVLVAAVAGSTPLIEGPASAATPAASLVVTPLDGYGFSDGMSILTLSQADLDRELDAVAATGATWLRVPFNWAVVEQTQGSYYWTANDRVVASAQAHGLQVLGNISYAPYWARVNSNSTAPPADPALFGGFAAAVATRYPSVTSWEVWNEPNLPQFFGGVSNPAKVYTGLLKAAYPAIKAVQPSSTVVSAGLSKPSTQGSTGPAVFLKQMYGAGAKGNMDAVGFHPYLSANELYTDSTNVWSMITKMRYQMTSHGDSAKKMWFTEFGNTTSVGGVSQQRQADLVQQQLAKAAATSYVGPCFLYSIRDSGVDPTNYAQNFGTLLTYDWQPKIAAGVLAD